MGATCIGDHQLSWMCMYSIFLLLFRSASSRYLDDELILGIDDSSLDKLTGAMIPVVSILLFPITQHCCIVFTLTWSHMKEPMYLILNTAISHRWGMPEPCPRSSCGACWRCYDCTNPGNMLCMSSVQLLFWILLDQSIASPSHCKIFFAGRLPMHSAGRNEELPQSPRGDESWLHPLIPGERNEQTKYYRVVCTHTYIHR